MAHVGSVGGKGQKGGWTVALAAYVDDICLCHLVAFFTATRRRTAAHSVGRLMESSRSIGPPPQPWAATVYSRGYGQTEEVMRSYVALSIEEESKSYPNLNFGRSARHQVIEDGLR